MKAVSRPGWRDSGPLACSCFPGPASSPPPTRVPEAQSPNLCSLGDQLSSASGLSSEQGACRPSAGQGGRLPRCVGVRVGERKPHSRLGLSGPSCVSPLLCLSLSLSRVCSSHASFLCNCGRNCSKTTLVFHLHSIIEL